MEKLHINENDLIEKFIIGSGKGGQKLHKTASTVIPLAPEPIVKGDGESKNDCERNAAKRLLSDLRREHPHLKVLIVEDGLASNFPHLSLLDSLNMQYVIGVKPGDHKRGFIENATDIG